MSDGNMRAIRLELDAQVICRERKDRHEVIRDFLPECRAPGDMVCVSLGSTRNIGENWRLGVSPRYALLIDKDQIRRAYLRDANPNEAGRASIVIAEGLQESWIFKKLQEQMDEMSNLIDAVMPYSAYLTTNGYFIAGSRLEESNHPDVALLRGFPYLEASNHAQLLRSSRLLADIDRVLDLGRCNIRLLS